MPAVLRISLILLAAAALAVVARFLFASSQQPAPPPKLDVKIRVSVAELPAGLLLRDDDLAWKAVPSAAVPSGAIAEGTPQAAKLAGALLRGKLAAGAVIMQNNVIQPDAPGFLAAALAPGMRAVSVSIDDVSGNAGLILPGDRVDMILTQNMQQGAQKAVVGETVVENARIIAVGSVFTAPREASGGANRARTITVEAPPRSAEAITVASRLGSLSLALRSFATTDRDAQPAQAATIVAQSPGETQPPIWGGDISRALRNKPEDITPAGPPSPSAPPKRSITLMRGSESRELNF